MDLTLTIFSWLFMLVGLFFCFFGVFGLWRMPDVYTKQHAMGLVDTTGASFIFLSLLLKSEFTLVSFKLIFLGILIVAFSAPTGYALMQFATRKKGDFTYLNDKQQKRNDMDD